MVKIKTGSLILLTIQAVLVGAELGIWVTSISSTVFENAGSIVTASFVPIVILMFWQMDREGRAS